MIENGCKWKALPKEFGNWHTIYTKFNRWSKNGTIDKIFEELQRKNIIEIRTEIVCIDSTSIKVTPRCCRSLQVKRRTEYRTFKRGLTTKLHLASTTERSAFAFHISAGNRHDAPEGRKLLETIYSDDNHYLLMDRAYEDDETRALAVQQGFIPVVPPKKNCKEPWEYDKELYKRRNEVERFFLRIKHFRKVFTRCDKLDIIYIAIVTMAMIFDAIF